MNQYPRKILEVRSPKGHPSLQDMQEHRERDSLLLQVNRLHCVRVQRQERGFTTICSRKWFTVPLGASSIPQIPEGINQRPPPEAQAEGQAQAEAQAQAKAQAAESKEG